MTALTKFRLTKQRPDVRYSAPVAASTTIFKGSLVVLDASGNAEPGSTALSKKAAGVAQNNANNSAGSAGERHVEFEKGCFAFENSADGDLITRAQIGSDAYIVDDQTVAKTDGSSSRSVAGKIMDVDADGVWIQFN